MAIIVLNMLMFLILELVDYKTDIFQSLLSVIGKSTQSTNTPEISPATIQLPESIGDREKEAYNKVEGVTYF